MNDMRIEVGESHATGREKQTEPPPVREGVRCPVSRV